MSLPRCAPATAVRHAKDQLPARRTLRRSRRSAVLRVTLAATLMLAAGGAMAPTVSFAGVFSFTRTDYPLDSYLNGLDSVAVADLDGQNGPDIIVQSLTVGLAQGTLNVLLNNGDGTFAPALHFETCAGAGSIVVGQFNPSTDSFLDVAMICNGITAKLPSSGACARADFAATGHACVLKNKGKTLACS